MRAYELLTEDPVLKQKVIRTLNKKSDDSPIFPQVYKVLVGEPISSRIKNYVQARGDKDALSAIEYLDKVIPTLGTADEVKKFLSDFKQSKYDFINIELLCPQSGMTKAMPLTSVVTNDFGKKLFNVISKDYKGKNDAGPGEAALAIMSPNITYAQGATVDDYGRGGDIIVAGVGKVEVKGGEGGRLTATKNLDQKGMTIALGQFQWTKGPTQKELAAKAKQDKLVAKGVVSAPEPVIPAPIKVAKSITANMLSNTLPEEFPAKEFMRAACQAWFGEERPELIKAVGTPNFKRLWLTAMYEGYREFAGWTGILFLNEAGYQYTTNANQIPNQYVKNFGMVYYPGSSQPRDMCPQIVPVV
jgi:hypothetical protein